MTDDQGIKLGILVTANAASKPHSVGMLTKAFAGPVSEFMN